MKSALLLVGNVMEKMTVGIILMKMDVVSKNYFKIFSDKLNLAELLSWSEVKEPFAYALYIKAILL